MKNTTPRRTQQLAAATASILLLGHLSVTALWASPNNTIKQSIGMKNFQYMNPVFSQNWGVFAPDINTSNNNLILRAKLHDGTTTPWIDATQAERQLTHFRPGGSRASRMSGEIITKYNNALNGLPTDTFERAVHNIEAAGGSPQAEHTIDSGNPEYLSLEQAAYTYATLAAGALWGSANIKAVQLGKKTTHTTPYAERHSDTPPRQEHRLYGWRNATETPGQNPKRFAETFGPLAQKSTADNPAPL